MKLEELLALDFQIMEITSSVSEVREVFPSKSELSLGKATDDIKNFYYDSDHVENVYDLATTSYEVYYNGERIEEELSNDELVAFIEEERYLEFVK